MPNHVARIEALKDELASTQGSLHEEMETVANLRDACGQKDREIERLRAELDAVEGLSEHRYSVAMEMHRNIQDQATEHVRRALNGGAL